MRRKSLLWLCRVFRIHLHRVQEINSWQAGTRVPRIFTRLITMMVQRLAFSTIIRPLKAQGLSIDQLLMSISSTLRSKEWCLSSFLRTRLVLPINNLSPLLIQGFNKAIPQVDWIILSLIKPLKHTWLTSATSLVALKEALTWFLIILPIMLLCLSNSK